MTPIQRMALIFIIIAGASLAGLAYLQFTSQTAYITTNEIKAHHQIKASDVAPVQFARLRDPTMQRLVITSREQIEGKYAQKAILTETLLLDNGMLMNEAPQGRCFSTGRCLPDGHTVWQYEGDTEDTLNGQVTVDDLVDLVLVDPENERAILIAQKMTPLDIVENTFLFAFTPAQKTLLDGINRFSASEDNLFFTLYLNQNPNELNSPFQTYSYDKQGLNTDLFPLPTPASGENQ